MEMRVLFGVVGIFASIAIFQAMVLLAVTGG